MDLQFIKDFIVKSKKDKNCFFKGRVKSVRNHQKFIFLSLVDHTGIIQVVVEKSKFKKNKRSISKISPASYIEVFGKLIKTKGNLEIKAKKIKIISKATLPLYPSPWEINGLDKKNVNQIFDNLAFYVANPERASILKIKANFIEALHEYFNSKGFTLVEPPTLTDKLLYDEGKSVKAKVHGENVYLTQCATFELEPLAMVFGKVYTISPAFRNENKGSRRHLAEYTHLKAEMLFAKMSDLILLAGESIYYAIKKTIENSKNELKLLRKKIDLRPIHPKNHVRVTYDEAFKILKTTGSEIVYGHGLSRSDEIILSEHFKNKYLWVMYLPFESEGFPYCRKKGEAHLSMTCDLIAPNGGGEIVGVAEKTTDIEEIIKNLIEKGKKKDIRKYWDYILLRKYGLPPHGGIGAAPERIIYGLLGLSHIKFTRPWPRYPSKKINPPPHSSLNPWKDKDIERLIKKYDLSKK